MKRRISKRNGAFAASIVVLLGLAAAVPLIAPPASAQEVIRRLPERSGWSIFDVFTPRRQREGGEVIRRVPDPDDRASPSVVKPRPPKTRVVARPSTPGLATTAREANQPEKAAVEKKADARLVLVVGDFMASGLAEALQNTFVESANVRILDRSQGSSGFARNDFYNWPEEISSILASEKPAAVVIMMGSNDRQAMRVGDKQEPSRSDGWTQEYETRTTALAEAIEAQKIPLLWVAVPAFKSPKMTSDMLAFNTIYKTAAEAGGGEFVDIWDGFVDENGAFVETGPDVNGLPVRLRGRDGINLSAAGKAKVAFYVERPLRKILGETGNNPAPEISIPALPEGPTVPVHVDRTDPIALDDPGLDGGTDLMGGTAAGAALPGNPLANASLAPEGRADAFNPPSIIPVQASAPASPVPPADTALRGQLPATPTTVGPQ